MSDMRYDEWSKYFYYVHIYDIISNRVGIFGFLYISATSFSVGSGKVNTELDFGIRC